jgi:YVTN family beta-propeller protein
VSAKTTWIVDSAQAPNCEDSLINGATAADFDHPPVLTDLQPGFPPFTFASTSVGGAVFANQTWGANFGVLPAAAAHAARQVDRAPAAAALAATPSPATAYVTNLIGGTVTPVDGPGNTAGALIAAGAFPDGVAVTPDGRTAYVAGFDGDTVTSVDVATPGTAIHVGNGPTAIAVTPDGRTAYVANSSDGTVTPIHVATNTARAPISVGDYPDGVAITPDGTTAYITNLFDDTVTPIALATNTPGTPVPVGSGPAAVAVTGPMQIGNDPVLPSGKAGTAYTQHLWTVAGPLRSRTRSRTDRSRPASRCRAAG